MRRSIILFFTFLIICLKPSAQTSLPGWVQLPDFPGLERDDGVVFVIGNKAYCGTGLQVGWALSKDFYCLDLTLDTWTTVASMPNGEERQYACGFTDGINGYVFGGEAGGNDLNTLWMYSPATNSWTAKASKPGNGVRGAACFVLGNIAYIIGGASGTTNALNEVWAYDMNSNTWTQKNNLPFTSWRGSASDRYLLFGRDLNGRFIKELYQYDEITDSWSLKSSFPNKGRSYAAMQTRSGDLLVFGGVDTLNTYYNEMWKYSTSTNTWVQMNSMPSAGRKGGMSFVGYMNNFYYTCGIDQADVRLKQTWIASFPDGVEEYDLRKNLNVYPNPANGVLNVDLAGSTEKFRITDLSGRIISEGTTTGTISVSNLAPGLYFLNLKGFSAKIIKQ